MAIVPIDLCLRARLHPLSPCHHCLSACMQDPCHHSHAAWWRRTCTGCCMASRTARCTTPWATASWPTWMWTTSARWASACPLTPPPGGPFIQQNHVSCALFRLRTAASRNNHTFLTRTNSLSPPKFPDAYQGSLTFTPARCPRWLLPLQCAAYILANPEPHAGKTYNLIGERQAGRQIVSLPSCRQSSWQGSPGCLGERTGSMLGARLRARQGCKAGSKARQGRVQGRAGQGRVQGRVWLGAMARCKARRHGRVWRLCEQHLI